MPTVCWVLCTGHYFSPLSTLLSLLLQSSIFQVRTVMLRKHKYLVLGSPVSPVAKLGLESRSPYANMEDHVTLAQVHLLDKVSPCPGCGTNHLCFWVPIVPHRNAPRAPAHFLDLFYLCTCLPSLGTELLESKE